MFRRRDIDGLDLRGEAVDGRYIRARYSYRAHEFTIERRGRMWWCHGGISVPIREPMWFHMDGQVFEAYEIGEATGFASLSRKSILRKLRRAVDETIRDTLADEQLETTLP